MESGLTDSGFIASQILFPFKSSNASAGVQTPSSFVSSNASAGVHIPSPLLSWKLSPKS